MSIPIPIPKRKCPDSNPSYIHIFNSCPDLKKYKPAQDNNAILIYPNHNLITPVTNNYNSYKTLCALIGGNPISIQLTHYDPCDSHEIQNNSYQDLQIKNEKISPISYDYIIYFDEELQDRHPASEYNYIISEFSGRKFWGRVIIIDDNPNSPVINSINHITESRSF